MNDLQIKVLSLYHLHLFPPLAAVFLYKSLLFSLRLRDCVVVFIHRGPTKSVCVADCYFIVNVLDLPFASSIAIYR